MQLKKSVDNFSYAVSYQEMLLVVKMRSCVITYRVFADPGSDLGGESA